VGPVETSQNLDWEVVVSARLNRDHSMPRQARDSPRSRTAPM
jgi:hypothetical protein